MSVFVVPPLDEQPWPSLGPQLCDFLEERAVHGPGDLRGRPAVIDQEKRALIYRAYEVFPRGHPRAGRRRFKRVAWSLRKGVAKTELAAWVAYGELHPEAPVRTDGWKLVDGIWQPVGAPVTDPYIPMLAYTEEQTEELAYGALLFIVQEGPDADLFDAGKEHITRIDGEGKALAVAGSPSAADGARTTHQHFDETHRMILPRLKDARQTMRNNLPKRVLADAWELETTTTYGEGQGSCAEDTHQYAEMIAAGKVKDATLFFFHREAPWRDDEDLDDPEQLKAAIREASGPAIALWPDFEGQVESIASLYHQPDTDKMYWQRVWLNRRRSAERNAFDAARWTKTLARPAIRIEHGEPITIGFDGARWRDAVGFIATHIETGFQWPLRYWVRPDDAEGWEVTDDDVDGVLTEAMDLYAVRLVYADPPRFESAVARWSGRYGERRVLEWYTNRPRQIGQAMRAFRTAQTSGELTHSGDKTYADHIGNAVRGDLNVRDDDETPLWTIYKIRPDSTKYIDLAMAGCLSWKARLDAIAKGGWKRKKRKQIIVRR
ncbi:Phage terminase-like protein, large subunit, contains N-terminal HTH domain [Micromonospora sediminicola]|uniref:Phage terminase-like protein, large subunit, contains N-terminal HTH domain n=1 Tax=Micromonospora sediminicola TaxID=946078 RepID=A0A1A9B556_9ACTN|nr:terminase [Micromonospora sediminicola]SBT64233.1 Phage terminase-like protein, large subunit, contains N-terminal HTH domain [Micromonospora sediminicola]